MAIFTGTTGRDRLVGSIDNDTLRGGLGADTMLGGRGNDTYYVNSRGDHVIESSTVDAEIDEVKSLVSYTLSANIENLTLRGVNAINATGNALNNVLIGNAAANSLNGGLGTDTLIGGAGNDVYYIDSTTDIIIEEINAGTDAIYSDVNYNLSNTSLEWLFLTGTTAISATGNASANALHGNELDNVLNGGEGNDYLNGKGGADTLIGGLGNENYFIDNPNDVIIELAESGTDTVRSSINFSLENTELENLFLSGSAISGTGNQYKNDLTGNDLNNVLKSGEGNDSLDGGLGADTLIGGLGGDTYYIDNTGDVIIESGNEIMDTVYSTLNYSLVGTRLGRLMLLDTAISAIGNEYDNTLMGNASDNILKSGEGNDRLLGGLGADTLNGGLGKDMLIGGAGSDTFVFANALINNNRDTITYFNVTEDKIQLENSVFTALIQTGILDDGMFKSGVGITKAAESDDYLIYNDSTGILYYDADANGTEATSVQIALIGNKAALTAIDFEVI